MIPVPLSAVLIRHLAPPLGMLRTAIETCPDDVWARSDGVPPIWQHALHAVFYLDKWLRRPDEPFTPPAFATTAAVDLEAQAAPAVDRAELLAYLNRVAERSRDLLHRTTDEAMLVEVEIHGGVRTLCDQAIGADTARDVPRRLYISSPQPVYRTAARMGLSRNPAARIKLRQRPCIRGSELLVDPIGR